MMKQQLVSPVKWLGLLFSISLLSSSLFLVTHSPTSSAQADTNTPQCNRYVIPVHISALDQLTTYHVAAWLCYNQTPGSLVQLTVHGATYNHTYWDFSCPNCESGNYSYTQYMGQLGYTVFNYDRLGDGESDHPLPELVTIQSDAYVLSQLISDLRTGSYGGPAFQKVILVGHSVGSAISIAEASDASLTPPDGVILTSFIHFVDPVEVTFLGTEVHPADLDPDPRFQGLPPGYITTDPGTRGQIFYYLPNADPNVITEDENTKDTATDSEFTSFFSIAASPISQSIHVPVLEVVGQYDNIFCFGTFDCTNTANVQQYEASFFAPDAHLQVQIIPQAGHDLNLQLNASVWESAAAQWIQSTFA